MFNFLFNVVTLNTGLVWFSHRNHLVRLYLAYLILSLQKWLEIVLVTSSSAKKTHVSGGK